MIVGSIVLTQGRRPAELERAVRSVLSQRRVGTDVVVVGNGVAPELPHDLSGLVRVLALPENVGIPAGRNAGFAQVAGEYVLFLDDDAELAGPDVLADAVAMFEADPLLGVVQPMVLDPGGGLVPRRFVPRLRVGDPARGSDIVALWEGACVARRSALAAAGAWPAEFFYMHEGIELAWRITGAGYVVRYAPQLHAFHPSVAPERHTEGRYLSARNRVWLARRNLPWPIAALYVLTWFLLDTARLRTVTAVGAHARGYLAGLRLPCGQRRVLSWRTIWRMTRLGRPPLI